MMNKKYKIESYHFMVLRSLAKDFPAGEVWHEDSPDFLIHTEDNILGIEHSLVQIPTRQRMPLQAIEGQTDEIASIAQEHAELRGMPPIQATLLFGHLSHMDKSERIKLARNISTVVYDKVTEVDIGNPFPHIIIRQPKVPRALSSIHIITLKEGSGHFWKCARAGWAMENCIEVFQETISKKEKLIRSYLKKCNKCWLLMVAEAKPSGFIHPNQESVIHRYSSTFERIYFMDLSERRLYLLNTVAI